MTAELPANWSVHLDGDMRNEYPVHALDLTPEEPLNKPSRIDENLRSAFGA